jgi:hypothetical protein
MAICIPIKLRTKTESERETVEQRKKLLPECVLPRETMKALAKATHFRIHDDRLEIRGKGALWPISRDLPEEMPDLADLRKVHCFGGKVEKLCINPRLFTRTAQAIGANGLHCKFTGPLGGIEVTSDRSPAWGMVMPMRSNDS